MKYKYVAIEQECGSGGSEIGRRLANQYGFSFYEKEPLEIVAEKKRVTIPRLLNMECNISDGLFYTMYAHDDPTQPTDMELHKALQNTIEELASQGPAIFVGNGAIRTLERLGPTLNVFICGNHQERVKYIMENCEVSNEEVSARISRKDQLSSNYFHFNMHTTWGNPVNFNIVLNGLKNGLDNCVDILGTMLREEANP